MPLRFRIYRWFRRSPGAFVRHLLANVIVFFAFAILVIGLNRVLGHDMAERGGMEIWYGFLVGFSSILTLNTIIELLGTNYDEQAGAM